MVKQHPGAPGAAVVKGHAQGPNRDIINLSV